MDGCIEREAKCECEGVVELDALDAEFVEDVGFLEGIERGFGELINEGVVGVQRSG